MIKLINMKKMMNRAIFIFRMCNFHWWMYFLNMIVDTDFKGTGPEKDDKRSLLNKKS